MAMYENVADHLIIPAFEDLLEKQELLQQKSEQFFTESGTTADFAALREAFESTYLSWQAVEPYNFGPAETVFLRDLVNNFPLNIQAMEANVFSGNYDLNSPDTYDKGLPALDYLLFGIADSDAEIIAELKDQSAEHNFADYFQAVLENMQQASLSTLNAWEASYRDEFIANDGTAAGTSMSLLVNALNQHFETIKRDRLGIPSGVLTLQIPNPDKVEAYYSGLSRELLLASITHSENLYSGMGGASLKEYLAETQAKKNEAFLSDLITTSYQEMRAPLLQMTAPLDVEIENNNEAVMQSYAASASQLIQLKTDMPSVLCISITYIDNPSDSD